MATLEITMATTSYKNLQETLIFQHISHAESEVCTMCA